MSGVLHCLNRLLAVTAAAILLVTGLFVSGAFAAGSASGLSTGLDVSTMLMGLLGGLALFLFGMEQMSDALKALAADRLKDILARLTTNRFMGAITGAIVTAIIQSSSVTTVLTVGFITAGILSVSQAVGIIFGANIGTTLTAQIVAFKVTKFSLLMIAGGFCLLFAGRRDTLRQYGAMIMGLGLVFFGMSLMSDAMRPLRSYEPFLDLMMRMENPLLGILVAAAFTALVQSSSATTGVVIAMAGQGLISLDAGIALIFGSNIGTCVTALLASLGKPRNAWRASAIHVLFNVVGVAIWFWFIEDLARLVAHVSPVADGLTGVDKLSAETPRQIANAHTIFNVANTLLFLPFATQFARLVEFLVPDAETDGAVPTGAATEWTEVHLDPELLAVPTIALEQTRGEIKRTNGIVRRMVADGMASFVDNDLALAEEVFGRTAEVEYIRGQIDQFLLQISRRRLNQDQSEEAVQLMDVMTDLAQLNNLIKKDLVPLLHRKAEGDYPFDETFGPEITAYFETVYTNLEKAMSAFEGVDAELAREVIRSKSGLVRQQRAYRAARLEPQDPSDPRAVGGEIHDDFVDLLRRIFSFAEMISFAMLSGYMDTRKATRAGDVAL